MPSLFHVVSFILQNYVFEGNFLLKLKRMYSGHGSFASFFVSHWDSLEATICKETNPILVNGCSLDLASVIAIAR